MARVLTLPLAALILAIGLSAGFTAEPADLNKLQGTWSTKRTTENGEVNMTLEISGDKLTYTVANKDNEVRLVAKGTVKSETFGPFRALKITDLQAGRSATETKPVEDERVTLYTIEEDTLTLVSNFDKERDGQKPALDVYKKTGPAKAAAAAADKLTGKWKMNVKMAENDREYELTFAGNQQALTGTLTSSRSGEHKLKSVTFADGKLAMELVRDIQGTEATIQYTGEFKDDMLTGTFTVKGYEEQFKGTWTAKR
jgi:hypothetical protein